MAKAIHRLIPATCKHCGIVFQAKASLVKRGVGGNFCTALCAAKSQKRLGVFVAPVASKAEKLRANGLINMRIRRGKLVRPTVCSECSIVCKTVAHHEDYSKPDEVEWLCRRCHGKRHVLPQPVESASKAARARPSRLRLLKETGSN